MTWVSGATAANHPGLFRAEPPRIAGQKETST